MFVWRNGLRHPPHSVARRWRRRKNKYVRPVHQTAGPNDFVPRNISGEFTVTCHPGLEQILSTELQILGLGVDETCSKRKRGHVKLRQATLNDEDLFRCCLYLGSATNIRWKCTSFWSAGLAELRRKTAKFDWGTVIAHETLMQQGSSPTPLARINVRVSSSKSKLYHTGAVGERILLGIYESFGHTIVDDKKMLDQLAHSQQYQNDATLLLDVQVERDLVEIFINAYPSPLHQRGYRLETAKAPLREDLAYSLLISSGWIPVWMQGNDGECRSTPKKNSYPGLLDPFCGSGTIIIEGVAMALGLPPGRLRSHPFQGTFIENQAKWKDLVDASLSRCSEKAPNSLNVSASDRDAGAIRVSKANAERAGIWQYLDGKLHRSSVSAQPWFEQPSPSPSSVLVVTNPPFGKRVSKKNVLLPLYQTLGHKVRQLAGSRSREVRTVLLTDDAVFATRVGKSCQLNSEKLLKTSLGGEKAWVLQWKIEPSTQKK